MIVQKIATSDYASPVPLAKQKGLNVHRCECGDTVWALPWNDELAVWDAYARSPLRKLMGEMGLAPPQPRISHHVVIASARDGDLLRGRRWRVLPSKPWLPHKIELRGGNGNGLPLYSHVLNGAKWLRIINDNGCDVRRENLRAMTKKEIGAVMRGRKRASRKLTADIS